MPPVMDVDAISLSSSRITTQSRRSKVMIGGQGIGVRIMHYPPVWTLAGDDSMTVSTKVEEVGYTSN